MENLGIHERPDIPMDFSPKLNILPEPQRAVWTELKATRSNLCCMEEPLLLRLGQRVSEDFDFFTNATFDPQDLLKRIPYLHGGKGCKMAVVQNRAEAKDYRDIAAWKTASV